MKKFRIFSMIWAALFGCILTANAQTEMQVVLDSTLWYSYAQEEDIAYTSADVSMTYNIGTSYMPASYDSYTQYFTHYSGSTLTFEVPGNYKITNIAITCNRDNTDYTSSTGSIADNLDGSGCTWTGEAQSVTLTLESTGESAVSIPSSSIGSIQVTYIEEDNPVEVDLSGIPSVSGDEHTFNFNAVDYNSFDNIYSVNTDLITSGSPSVTMNITNGQLAKWSSDYYGDVVRLVDNGAEPLQLVLTVTDGYVITGVTYEDYEDNRYNLSCDVGTFTSNQWTGSTQTLTLTATAAAYIDRMVVTVASPTVPTVDLSVIPQTEGSENEMQARFNFDQVSANEIMVYTALTNTEGYVIEDSLSTFTAGNTTLALTSGATAMNYLSVSATNAVAILNMSDGGTMTISVPTGYRISSINFIGLSGTLQPSAGTMEQGEEASAWNGTGEGYGLNTVTFTAASAIQVSSIEVGVIRYTHLNTPNITNNGNVITIESSNPDALIRYSVDGSTPDLYSPATGTTLDYTGPFTVTENCVVKAIAGGDYFETSEVASLTVDWFQVDTVKFSRNGLELTMTCDTEESTILYTLQTAGQAGTTLPDTLTYRTPITLTESCTINALGRRTGWTDSEVKTFTFNAADVTVATPQIYRDGETVAIACTTPNAVIRYTTDGTIPDSTSTVYGNAFVPEQNYTIRAYATANGYFNSAVAEFTVDWLKVANVEFRYSNLELTMSTTTSDASIYFTIDGTTPSATNGELYTAPVTLAQSCTVRAIAVRNGWTDSDITSYEFSIDDVTAATPQFARGQNNELIIATATQQASIYYTLDGSIPTINDSLYTAPLHLDGNFTVNAIAAGDGLVTSPVATFTVDWYTVANVEFSYKNLKLAMSTTTSDASIFYTLDGTTPTNASTQYVDSLTLTQDCTVQAIAVRQNWNDSEVTSYTFNLSNVTAVTPQITHNGNIVTIETTTAGATIYYTTDGTTPTVSSNVYDAPFEVIRNCTIKAIATGTGLNSSDIATYEVDWFKVGDVEFSLNELQLVMTTTPDYATIYYTLDGTVPTVLSAQYTAPVMLTTSCDVRAIAMLEGWANSEVSLFHFNALNYTAAKPMIVRNGNELTITTTSQNAEIHYTTDGTEPNDTTTLYATPIALDGNCTVRAIATGLNYLPSAISTYTVDWFKVADVEFAWSATNALTLELSTTTPDATIYYTTDGSVPLYVGNQLINGQKYTAALTMTQQDMDIRAIAVRENWTNSDATLFHFNSASMTVATPQIIRSGNELNISCATPNVTIYYTLNGAEPTVNDSAYNQPIALDGNGIVRAVAISAGQFRSAIASYQVDWFKVASVDFAYVQGTGLTMSTTTPDASIYYTIDGTTPSATNGTQYTAPVQLTESRDVRAIALRNNWNDSEISLFHYIYGSTPAATPLFVRNGNELTITSETTGAEIFYTLDGTTPTEQSELYTAPIVLQENGLVKAIAIVPGESQSGVASYTVNWFAVENILFSFINQQLVMQTATNGATIYYTLDGTEPTTASNVYTAPITVIESCLVQAFGTRANMHNSNISRYDLDLDNLSTATPIIERVGNTLVISCATADAVIYYTTDGSLPTVEEGLIYTAPIVLTQNCTVRAIAVAQGYRNSGVADYTTDTFRVEDVNVQYADGFLFLFTNTAGATIHYTLDGTEPSASSEVYSQPIPLTEKKNVKAIAMKDGYTNSQITSVEKDPAEERCAEPIFAVNDRMLTISTITSGAQIYYTFDGTTPTTSSKLYAGPDTLTHNCTVRAIAIMEGSTIKNSAVSNLVVDNFQVELPEIVFNQADNTITFSTRTPNATIYYSTDDTTPATAYTSALTWDGSQVYRVMAQADDFNPSAVVTFNPASPGTCAPVQMTSYDGRAFTLSSSDNAAIYYTLDGSNPTASSIPYVGQTTVNGLTTIRAIAVKEGYNNSNVAIVELPCFFDGQKAIVREAGSLSQALGDMQQQASLTIEGNLNAADFMAIRNARSLRYLDLSQTALADATLPDGALASSSIVSIVLPQSLKSIGSDVFAGCNSLAAIIWSANKAIPAGTLDEVSNPNLLLYVNRAAYAPSHIRNVVTGFQAQRITLSDAQQAGNFYCPRTFYAQDISYTHSYQLKSGLSHEPCGWETLALPFNVTTIQHESKGLIAPFASISETAQQYPKFWLYTLDAHTGRMTAVADIEANSPYLICMPNNDEYADRFKLNGNVTFKASNTMIPATAPKEIRHSRNIFVANFERKAAADDILLINRNVTGRKDGEIFLASEREACPFEAYFTNSDASVRAIGLFDDDVVNEISTVMRDAATAEGTIYNLNGQRISKPGKQGLYIVNGKKVFVK